MKHAIVLILCLLLGGLPAAAERGILGAMSYDSPLGCAPDSVFNLVAGSILNTFGSSGPPTSGHSFNILPQYNNGQGAAFQYIPNSGAQMVMATSGLQPLSFFGSLIVSTGGNPDNSATFGTISLPGTSEVFLHAQQQVTPCASPPCLHHYIFNTSGGGPGISTNFVIPSANSSQGTLGGIYDGSSIYFLQRLSTPINHTMLWQFDASGTTTLGFLDINATISTREMIDVNGSLYFRGSPTNQIFKVIKDGFVLSQINITPSPLLDNLSYSPSQNVFFLTVGNGLTTLNIYRYDSTLTSFSHTLAIGAEFLAPGGLMMDEQAQKLYIVTEPAGSTIKRIRRINPSSLTIEQTLSIDLGTNGFVAAPDFTHRYLWISDIGNPSHIQRVQLCT